MKKSFIIVFISILFVALNERAEAQNNVGGGISYGTEIKNIGIHADGQFYIKDNIAISPSITYYLPKKIYEGFNFKWFEVNANANYYFMKDTNVDVYGLAGINLSFVSFPFYNIANIFGGTENTNATSTYFGLNIGIGADFNLSGNITPFGQLRYNIGSFDQLAIEAGVRIPIN